MKTKSMKILSLSVLTLILFLGVTDQADARIRAKSSRRAPRVAVQIDAGALRISGGFGQSRPGRYREQYRVTKRDRKIAHRLGRYMGVQKRELIQLKKQGYSWNEIGRWLGVSRKAVRAAKSSRSWERFLDRRHRRTSCEIGGH